MLRFKITHLIFITIFVTVLSLGVTNLSAQQIVDDEAESTGPDKPMSYAEYRRTEGPVELIGDDAFNNPTFEESLEPEKHIIISLADQTMWVFEGDRIVQEFLVSTGTWGRSTPTGQFQVRNQATRAYSQKYDAWMLHWMAITPNGAYGMHSLLGTSYLRRLGSVASHGCIRLSHENAEWLYGWVDIGTQVEIVSDWTEPPEEKTIVFRTGKFYCL